PPVLREPEEPRVLAAALAPARLPPGRAAAWARAPELRPELAVVRARGSLPEPAAEWGQAPERRQARAAGRVAVPELQLVPARRGSALRLARVRQPPQFLAVSRCARAVPRAAMTADHR